MLSILGFLTIVVFLVLIILKKLSVVTALVIVPIVFGLLAGFNIKELTGMMFDGIKASCSNRNIINVCCSLLWNYAGHWFV